MTHRPRRNPDYFACGSFLDHHFKSDSSAFQRNYFAYVNRAGFSSGIDFGPDFFDAPAGQRNVFAPSNRGKFVFLFNDKKSLFVQ